MDNIMKDILERSKRQKELISNTSYIEWLCEFTQVRKKFISTQWVYQTDLLFADDSKNVDLLPDFFAAIEEYCEKNMIAYTGTQTERSYAIKYKGVHLDIGVCIGQGAFNFVERKDEVSDKDIDFEDIINAASHELLDKKLQKISELENLLDEMKDLGMSKEQIITVIKNKDW